MNKGIQLAFTTAVISGFAIFLSKLLVAKIDPIVFTALKNIFTAAVLSFIIFNSRLKTKILKLSKGDWLRLFIIGLIGGSIPFALFFTGLKITTAANAAILHKTLFVWAALFAMPFLHERLKFSQMIGYVLVLWGVLWTTGLKFSGDTGEIMVLAATILWAVENVIAKAAIRQVPGIIVAWGRMTFGSMLLLGLLTFQGKMSLLFQAGGDNFLPFLISSLLLVGYVATYYSSLQYIPVTIASSILVVSAPITALLQALFITRTIDIPQLQSSGLVFVGVGMIIFIFIRARTVTKEAYES